MPVAKITRPGFTNVFRRERLFQLLDHSRAPVVWISAPPGAGKTTLLSSYLAEREVPHLWYQLDRGDDDLATFFHYLGLAVSAAAPRVRVALPHLTAEYLAGVRVFARRYFEALASQLGPPFVLALDNYQEVSADAALHAVIREGIGALPRDFRTIVLSRAALPAELRGHKELTLLGWNELQLTLEEVEGIERLRKRKLHGQSSRWAAGLVLLLEQGRTNPAPQASPESNPQVLFDHFAAEIFSRLDAQTQSVLLASALLPKMTAAMVAELTSVPAAGALLEELHRKNYFTLKHVQAEPTYEYHPLFREFLLSRARLTLPAVRLQALRRKAAALALADGQLETAAELLRACGDFDGVAQLVLTHARALIEQGRAQVVEEWLSSLPGEARAANGWLSYWYGACRLAFNPAEARVYFEQAYQRFKSQQDMSGCCLAWCAVVDSFVFEWGNFKPLGAWLAEMEALLAAQPALDPPVEAQVACGMFLALMYAQPEHPEMRLWEQRVRQIILYGGHRGLQVKVGNHLLIYYTWWTGDLDKAELLVESLRAQIRQPGMPPLLQITWDAMASGFYWMSAANAECLACVERGLDTARTNGVHTWDMLLCSQGVFASLSSGDADVARRYLERMEMSLSMSRPMDHAIHCYHSAWYRFAEGNLAGAREFAQKAVTKAEAAGAGFPAAVMRNDLGRVLCYLGDTEGGLALIRQARDEGRAMNARTIEYLTFVAEAEIALERNDEASCVEHLRHAFAVGNAQQFRNHTWWSSKIMSRLYAVALAHDIETEYVSAVMHKRGLQPPRRASATNFLL